MSASAVSRPPPARASRWVRAGLSALPDAMKAGGRRANAVERGAVDLVEAVLLEGREGERFDAVVIDEALIQLREPASPGRLEGVAGARHRRSRRRSRAPTGERIVSSRHVIAAQDRVPRVELAVINL